MLKKTKETRSRLLQVLREHLDAAGVQRGEAEAQLGKRRGWLSDRKRYGIEIRELAALLGIIGLHPVEFLQDVLEGQFDQRFHRGHPIQTKAAEIWHCGTNNEEQEVEQWLPQMEELRYRDPETALNRIGERLDTVPRRNLPLALGCAGSALRVMLRLVEAEGLIRQALDYASRLDDQLAKGSLLQRLSYVFSDQGYYHKAIRQNDLSLEVYLSIDSPVGLGRALVDRGVFRTSQGQFQLAKAAFQTALPLLESTDNRNNFGALQGLAYCCIMLGAHDEALEIFPKAKEIEVDPVSKGKLEWSLGLLFKQLGRDKEAVKKLDLSIGIFEEFGSVFDSTLASLDLCETYLQLNRVDAAHTVAAQTIKLVSSLQSEAPWLAPSIKRLAEIGAAGTGISDSFLGRIRERIEGGNLAATEKIISMLQADEPLISRTVRILTGFLRRQGVRIADFEKRIGKAKGWLADRTRYSVEVTEFIQILQTVSISPIDFFQEVFDSDNEGRKSNLRSPIIKKARATFNSSDSCESASCSRRLKALDEGRHEDPDKTIKEITRELLSDRIPRDSIPLALGVLGSAHRIKSELSLAREYALEAIRLTRELDDSQQLGQSYQRLSFVFYDQRRLSRALEVNSLAIEMHLYASSDVDLGKSLVDRGIFRGTQENNLLSNRIFGVAKKLLNGSGESRNLIAALQGQTRTYVRLHKLDKAMECAREASKVKIDRPTAAKLQWTIGVLYARKGDYDEAIRELSECRNGLVQVSPVDAILAQIDLCETCFEAKKNNLAYFHAAEAIEFSMQILKISVAAHSAVCELANLGLQKALTPAHLGSIRARVKGAAARPRRTLPRPR